MKTTQHNLLTKSRATKLLGAMAIALLSVAIISSCSGKSDPSKENNTSNTPVAPSSISQGFMEDALPGNSLLNGSLAQNSFKVMAENLSGRVTFTVVEEKTFDYMVNPSSNPGQPSTLSRQDGKQKNPNPFTYQGVAGINPALSRLGITLIAPQNSYEVSRTFVFQYQMNILGLTLTSTDQVALFKATQSSPFANDFLKVNYTTKNPTIQRFRMSQLSPFPISGLISQPQTNFWGTQWINVVSQKITTVFQNPY